MKRLTCFLVFIFISSHSFLFSQSHNQLEVDLERIKKDIIDLQKFVYKNSDSSTTQQNESFELENLNQLLGRIGVFYLIEVFFKNLPFAPYTVQVNIRAK